MKIICLSCGHKVDLGDAYDDYAGQIKCATCSAILDIKTEAGGLKAVAVTRGRPLEASAGAAPVHEPAAVRY
ncbi:MAG: hypothetical protein HYX77_01570 [Acidobacteria bacterium]|nr:hypothetical protein [Acidobacteriota bacterium]